MENQIPVVQSLTTLRFFRANTLTFFLGRLAARSLWLRVMRRLLPAPDASMPPSPALRPPLQYGGRQLEGFCTLFAWPLRLLTNINLLFAQRELYVFF